MRTAVLILAAFAASTALADSPSDALRGKMKPGMYAYKMDSDMGDMPGLPPGMGRQSMTMQHCVTPQDMEKGQFGKGPNARGQSNCEMKDFRMSGDTATYKMVCKGEHPMTADAKIAFRSDGFQMHMKMAMDQGGHPVNMTQSIEAKYLGPCSK